MCLFVFHCLTIENLYKIKECKYKYPDQIHKVPIQSYFFNHFIMAPALIRTDNYIEKNNTVQKDTDGNVESVETGYKEKEIGKQRIAVFVVAKVCAFNHQIAISQQFVFGILSGKD